MCQNKIAPKKQKRTASSDHQPWQHPFLYSATLGPTRPPQRCRKDRARQTWPLWAPHIPYVALCAGRFTGQGSSCGFPTSAPGDLRSTPVFRQGPHSTTPPRAPRRLGTASGSTASETGTWTGAGALYCSGAWRWRLEPSRSRCSCISGLQHTFNVLLVMR